MDEQNFQGVMDAFSELEAIYEDINPTKRSDEIADIGRSFEKGRDQTDSEDDVDD